MKTAKIIISLALVIGAIVLVYQLDKNIQNNEVVYGQPDAQIRQTEESNNPSP